MERSDLIRLVAQLGCAQEAHGCRFLCDPQWSATELKRAQETIALPPVESPTGHGEGWLCIPTGGTSGGVRFARHDEKTLSAAVAGFCQFFDLAVVNVVDVLPPFHVSGLMARVRCAATDGQHLACDWRRIEAGEWPALPPVDDGWVISLVPTQLQRLLSSAAAIDWLRRFRIVFIGGGPMWSGLSDAAAQAKLRIALTYGMTETAAMVAAVSPTDFSAGERKWATPLPHAKISLDSNEVVRIEGPSVFRGYYPEFRADRSFSTEDLGAVDEVGRISILGRRDAVIISGGKKIHPSEVEAALRGSGEFADVAVIGLPDSEWGQIVVACFSAERVPNRAALDAYLSVHLASYKRPKRFVPIAHWPRSSQGKVARSELARLAAGVGAS